jgi:hypothetical protein
VDCQFCGERGALALAPARGSRCWVACALAGALWRGRGAASGGPECTCWTDLRPDRQRQALVAAADHPSLRHPRPAAPADRGAGALPRPAAGPGRGLQARPRPAPALQVIAPNAQIREFYGAAEASFITLADETTPENSVGRPYPGVEVSLDPTGEIWVKSPYLFVSYAEGDPKCQMARRMAFAWARSGRLVGEDGKRLPVPERSRRTDGHRGRSERLSRRNRGPAVTHSPGVSAALPSCRCRTRSAARFWSRGAGRPFCAGGRHPCRPAGRTWPAESAQIRDLADGLAGAGLGQDRPSGVGGAAIWPA